MNYKNIMKSVWSRGAMLLFFMTMNTVFSATASVGLEGDHGTNQLIALARLAIVIAFVVGVIFTVVGLMGVPKFSDDRASGSEKWGVGTKLLTGIGLIGVGIIIEFFTGAILGQAEVSRPTGVPDDIW